MSRRKHPGPGGLVISLAGVAKPARFPFRPVWVQSERAFAYNRAGKRCEACESRHDLTVHHIRQRAHGGGDEAENLAILCERCHKLYHQGKERFWPWLLAKWTREMCARGNPPRVADRPAPVRVTKSSRQRATG